MCNFNYVAHAHEAQEAGPDLFTSEVQLTPDKYTYVINIFVWF
jgi:hypothetical protein